jgi:small conductance mechanosensitive channel
MSDVVATLSANIPKILLLIGIVFATFVLARRVRVLGDLSAKRIGFPSEIAALIGTVAYIVVVMIGSAIGLTQAGWSTAATSFLAGLGATGVIAGLAIKDVATSHLAGLLLLYRRPFQIGDDVCVAGTRGEVVAMRLHATTVRTPQGLVIEIPNHLVNNAPITNYQRSGIRKVQVQVTLTRPAEVNGVARQLADVVRYAEHLLSEPAPTVRVVRLQANTVTFAVVAWAHTAGIPGVDAQTELMLTIDRYVSTLAPSVCDIEAEKEVEPTAVPRVE